MGRILLAVVLVSLPVRAFAAEQTVLGKQLMVKNTGTRKIMLQALETSTDNTIVGNPVATGATLTINAYGGASSAQTYNLPSGMNAAGKPFWSGDATTGFKYKDSGGENGPVTKLQMTSIGGVFQIKATINGKAGTISVLPPNEGLGACARLAINSGDAYSVRFGDGSITNKKDALFKVKNPMTQGSCVVGCGNGFVDPGEQCDPVGSFCGTGGLCQSDCTCPCDFLDTSECMFPFPSDYLTVADGTTDTGRRVHFAWDTMPHNASTPPVRVTPTDYNLNDGFSPGASILLHVPNVDLVQTGAAPITDLARSLEADAPIVLVNATTLEHHLMWAELDSNATSEPTRALIIRPAISLDEGTRYIVALRNMKDSTGATIPASADFAAYRDGTPTGNPVVEARRAHMEEIFTTLGSAGVGRSDLYMAWDFTVASERNLTERMLFVRDDGFTRLGSNAPSFTVTNVEENVDSNIFRRVTGTYNVERYVNSTSAPALFVLGPNGLPTHQSTPQVAPFICNIPYSALADSTMATAVPARASIYGHGLLGSNDEVEAGNVEAMGNEHNFVFCATKWIGMADEDVANAVNILIDISKFPSLTDRLQQSMLDQLFLARLMIHAQGFVSDPAFQDVHGNPVIDTSAVFYDGNSQGGIFGGTVMSISQDITRGVLGVPGMNYSLLLTRSTDFAAYSLILYPSYPKELERPLVLALIQMLWDRSDPNGYAHHMTTDPLPNTPQHTVLIHEAFGDHQVANIATEVEARTIGASIHKPAIAAGRNSDVTPYYGIPGIPSYPFDGSGIVVWDSGAVPPPTTNTSPSPMTHDPHPDPRNSPDARQQKSDFLQSPGGVVNDVCSGLPCVAPQS
jgi:hypothetical protein